MLIFCILICASCIIAIYVYHTLKTTANIIYVPMQGDQDALWELWPDLKMENEKERMTSTDIEEKDIKVATPISVLLMGVDERTLDQGRSDTLILAVMNPNDKKILLLSIPRDTYVELAGLGYKDKINHAYAFGGTEMAINTVEQFIGIPVDYYIQVNMEGFVQLINVFDGVDVINDFSFEYEGYLFEEGALHLDGQHALKFSRMRYDDPRGDFGRNDRQKKVIEALMKKGMENKFTFVQSFPTMIDIASQTVSTNIAPDEILSLYDDYADSGYTFMTEELRGSDRFRDAIYYYDVDDTEIHRVRKVIKDILYLPILEEVTR